MARSSFVLAAAILLSAIAGQASAASCRDANGKFIACPAAAVAQKGPCRDPNGKFIKCAVAAKPAPAMAAASAKPAPRRPRSSRLTPAGLR